MFAPKKILVPTDFSEHSDLALANAINVARTYSSKVYVLHVVDEFLQQCAMDYCLDAEVIEQISKGATESSHVKIKKQVDRALGSNGVAMDLDVKVGDPYEEIMKFQKRRDIDLIVIALHGKRSILKNLIGSIADRLIRLAPCSLLIVKE